MKISFPAFVLIVALFADIARAAEIEKPVEQSPSEALIACNVVWDSPSTDSKGSMPIGNGDIGLNAWVEPDGDLVFLVGKTDAWDENMSLLKLGKVRVKFTPSLVEPGKVFSQTLDLPGGRIIIKTDDKEVVLWVDANHPIVEVDARSLTASPLSATASLEMWRSEKRPLGRGEVYQSGVGFSYPDTVLPAGKNQIGWYHRNVASGWLENLKLQKLDEVAKRQTDPLMNRNFGAILRGDHWASVSATELRTEKPAKNVSLRLHVLTQITQTPEAWIAALNRQADAMERLDVGQRRAAHTKWWSDFWQRSWIFVSGDAKAQRVTSAYTLQRFINACGGRGAYPIKFNGSIFVMEYPLNRLDADYRAWGGPYWFQNTRLTYWSMLSAGDFDQMQPFFSMYAKALYTRQLATQKYYGHAGAFFPETMTIWGTYVSRNYGTNRQGRPDGQTDNPFIRRYWQGGLEMVAMMLDYHDLTQDDRFRDETLLPYAKAITTFFDQHWPRDEQGKIRFAPAQSLETWHSAVNPLPEIAGLRFILPRLQAKTRDAGLKSAWQKTLDDLPPVPTLTNAETGSKRLLPAEQFSRASNTENPELYAVFPYRLYTQAAGPEALQIGNNTWVARRHPENFCWQQNGIQAALLGRAGEARRYVESSAAHVGGSYRFPAMWGPNHDWTPDQDHGGVIMIALQRMLMQCEGDQIMLLPAWPKQWNGTFKLHAPKNTTVEGRVQEGKILNLKVSPPARAKDVVVRAAQ